MNDCLLVILLCTTILRAYNAYQGHNFDPFWSYKEILAGNTELIADNLLNLVVFMPLGFLLGLAFERISVIRVLIIGLVLSITVECIQLLFNRGFAEFDDVLHNVIGCIIGFGLFSAAICCVHQLKRHNNNDNYKQESFK